MSPDVRAVEEYHAQSRIPVLYPFEKRLPDTRFRLPNEQLGRSPPGAKFGGNGPPFRPVLMPPEDRRDGPPQIARRGFTFRTDRLNQRFPHRPRIIGKHRLHHAHHNELCNLIHVPRPNGT